MHRLSQFFKQTSAREHSCIPRRFISEAPLKSKKFDPKLPPFQSSTISRSIDYINGQKVEVQKIDGTPRNKQERPVGYDLKVPLPGFEEKPEEKKRVGEKWPTVITRLNNGMRVVTQNIPSPSCAVSLFVDAGAQYETDANHGVTHLLERMSFQSTKNMESKRLVEELENLGGNITTTTQRDMVNYSCESLPENVPRMIELLSDITVRPAFADDEIEEQKEGIKMESEDMKRNKDIQPYISDIIHSVAYNNQPLGRALSTEPELVDQLNSQVVREYHSKLYVPPRFVLAVAGYDHDQVVELSQRHFNVPYAPSVVSNVTSKWTGGIWIRRQDDLIEEMEEDQMDEAVDGSRRIQDIMSNLVLAFETKGTAAEETFPLAVLLSLFGGGGSFSAGGPGKGMYSRLYRNVLNGYGFVDSVQSFTSGFAETGMLGIHATCRMRDNNLDHLQQTIVHEMLDVVKRIDSEEFTRAQNQAKSGILMALESRNIVADDMGRQILIYNKRYSAEEIVNSIDRLTVTDVQDTLARIMSSRPAMVLAGSEAELKQCAMLNDVEHHIKQHIRPTVL
ncbi:hypothetical protein PROFUN_15049 [Planoprotostelium fungivorum]|uniref:Alpha-MPP n=1 Tax=Planoprotostelium fungivorum TaxID=1890364 RepID=A0A2P6MXU0_9EUKA|nr:hypothetical protein PROFUN_15049 [Planoprotostelium fungivorum]